MFYLGRILSLSILSMLRAEASVTQGRTGQNSISREDVSIGKKDDVLSSFYKKNAILDMCIVYTYIYYYACVCNLDLLSKKECRLSLAENLIWSCTLVTW